MDWDAFDGLGCISWIGMHLMDRDAFHKLGCI